MTVNWVVLCAWCGHRPHDAACPGRIQTGPKTTSPCPCVAHEKEDTP